MPETDPQHRTRQWKRRVILALLFLCGGAVVNVAVAWSVRFVLDEDALQLRDPAVFRTGGGGGRSAPGKSVQVQDSAALRRQRGTLYSVCIPFGERASLGVSTMHMVFSRADTYLRREPLYLNASASPHSMTYESFNTLAGQRSGFRIEFNADGEAMIANPNVRSEYNAGWPCRSLRWAETCEGCSDHSMLFGPPGTGVVMQGGWRLPDSLGEFRNNLPLPLYPILTGFIVNTTFYALLLWLLFFAPFAARRMFRRRRGLCETCAYPIGVSPVCTECGAAVSRRNDR